MTLSTLPKREREQGVSRTGMLVCMGSVYYHLLKAAWRLYLKCSKKFTKKSCLAKLRITVNDYFLISVPAIQGDFLETDVTIIYLAS